MAKPRRFITAELEAEMRRLRWVQKLSCNEIGERLGVSPQCVSEHTFPKTGDLRDRWAALLPDMILAVKAAAERA